ncbi:MAG: glycogen/starch synthase, partial [Ignavibacteria bacterium]|nr:glycogen/starch synthase [Ignavibacteria bacterium]
MKVCFVTSECDPFVKTGGLADVSGSLPVALSNLGCQVKIFLPLYDLIDINKHNLKIISEFKNNNVQIGEKKNTFNLFYGKLPNSNVEVYFIDCPEYYNRGKVYTDDKDEDERFIIFQNAVLITLQKLNWAPDIMHCNDWQASLIPVYLKTNFNRDRLFSSTSCLLSIHNIGYQGRFPKETVLKANLSYENYYPDSPYELDNSFCFLKTGIVYSDIISTVSPAYAKEIQTSDFGAGLDNVLRDRKNDLYGILNGIDTKTWNPETDDIIPYNYTFQNIENKLKNKKELLEFSGLEYEEDTPVIGIVSRFAWQKGFELLVPIFDELMEQRLKFVILGDGEKKYEEFFKKVSLKYVDKVFLYIGYNNELAH